MAEPLRTPLVDSAKPGPAQAGFSLLFVDDEANILNALRRLFRPAGYRIFTAGGGAEGLAILERETIDIVISDMRMPEMDGAQFLAEVCRRRPETTRILLTGYADIGSTIAAINEGRLHRYITKPWNDQEVQLVVRDACERHTLERERARLEALTLQQNGELKMLNATLEARVVERTAALQAAHSDLAAAHESLKTGFLNTIKVFSGLIEMRGGAMAGHSRRVADHARRIALALKMPAAEVQEIVVAALLHDIGTIGLPDALLAKPVNSLTPEERSQVVRHPAKAESVLMGLEQLRGSARLIRSHQERYDGQGYPDHLSGLAIPRGARILAVANDYDSLLQGAQSNKRLSPEEARAFLLASRGKRYDPVVVDAFVKLQGGPAAADKPAGTIVPSALLEPGMVLARDLVTRDGVLLLARDFILDAALIAQIRAFERAEGYTLTIAIQEHKP